MGTYDPTLPAGSTLGKSYEYGVEVFDGPADQALTAAATDTRWLPIRRALNVNAPMTPITQDAQSYDDKGSPNADVSAWSFSVTLSAYVNRSATTGEPVPELKVLQQRYGDKKGNAAVVGVRWYHKPSDGSTPDPAEAFQGLATVAYTRNNTGADGANEQWGITLTGKGYATRITNPFSGWSGAGTAPVILSIGPAGRNAGDQVTVTGTGFNGVTGITLGGTAVASDLYTVINSSTIVLTIPPATAVGAKEVVVTNAGGSSAGVNYTVV